jgi:CheY-like chemotaxis protein
MQGGRPPATLPGALRARQRRHERLVSALQRQNLRSEQARRAAEAAHHAKVRFFASVNHDLRQPLNALGLLAQTLQARATDADTHELADHMVACVDGMGQVVDELLGLARLDAGPLAPQPAAWQLSEVLHEVACTFAPLARLKGLALAVQVAPQGRVCCDRALLTRVLGNLVANAIRYTAAGSVRLVAHDHEAAVELSVQDTGIGIPAQHLPHIFDEFYQAHNPQRDRRAGLGLGLATVKRLSTLMGLPVRVHSVVGQGSRFTLTLPRAPAQPQRSAAQAWPPGIAPDAPMHCRVLVIDDDDDSRAALRGLLLAWGCEVQAMPAWAQAEPAFSTGWRPDVVVADMHLAQAACGLAAVREVRARWGDALLPALLITGDVGSARMQAAQAQGYTVMTKPIKAVRLRAFLNQALAGRVERRLAVRVVAG